MLAGLFATFVGLLLLGIWISLSVSKLPELKENRTEMIFIWAAELLTAIVLVAGGVGLLTISSWGQAVYLLAMGLLLYTVIVSPASYLYKRQWPKAGLFAVLVPALISIGLTL